MKAILIEGTVKGELAMYLERSLYPKKNGLYVFDDGVCYMLCDVMEDSVGMTFTIPRDSIIKEYERIGERDIDLLQKQLSELNKQMKDYRSEVADVIESVDDGLEREFKELKDSISQNDGGQQIDLSQIAKLVAVSQKPELIDKKVN